MIVSSDIATIIFRLCEPFGLPTQIEKATPREREALLSERIVIHPKKVVVGKIWNKAYVEVNLCVPDIEEEADLVRLQELERQAEERFEIDSCGDYDGTTWYISMESIGLEADAQMKCHFVNVRLLFEILNIK